ncbi:MAG: 50S ribosomal protein L5 [archaeon]
MTNMKDIKVEKVTLNIGTGKPGPELEKALKLLNKITGKKPCETKTKKRIPTWGVRPGLVIGCKVTVRGKEAEALLERLFLATDHKLDPRKLDSTGNLSFGIKEYLDIPGTEYDISIGIIGLDAAVTLTRAGYSIKRRKLKSKSIGKKHRITKEEARAFLEEKFKVKFGEQ